MDTTKEEKMVFNEDPSEKGSDESSSEELTYGDESDGSEDVEMSDIENIAKE